MQDQNRVVFLTRILHVNHVVMKDYVLNYCEKRNRYIKLLDFNDYPYSLQSLVQFS